MDPTTLVATLDSSATNWTSSTAFSSGQPYRVRLSAVNGLGLESSSDVSEFSVCENSAPTSPRAVIFFLNFVMMFKRSLLLVPSKEMDQPQVLLLCGILQHLGARIAMDLFLDTYFLMKVGLQLILTQIRTQLLFLEHQHTRGE